ncbi:hypothetical protein Q4I32_007223 [Leishmania shawi]|uniref:Secreted protein n=1 Tax=Leishmania shawi TaxID=5680 RepID=A0AAW3BCZ6_9TRYP
MRKRGHTSPASAAASRGMAWGFLPLGCGGPSGVIWGVTALAEQRAARHLRIMLSLSLCSRCGNPRYSQVPEQSWVRVAFCRLVSPASLSF